MEKPKVRKDDDGLISASSSVDRISELPQPILHHILCFLSQNQAVQTCLLSKSWRHLWCERPILEFRENLFGNKKTFLTILEHTLLRYLFQNLSIKQVVVEASGDAFELKSLLALWIPLVFLYSGVETFRLILSDYRKFALPLFPFFFGAEFLKELYLGRCIIEYTYIDLISFKHLKSLSLHHVYIEDDKTMEKIIASCPLIERLDLVLCDGFTTVRVNNLKHFRCLSSTSNIEIKDPSALETIKIGTCRNWYMQHANNHHFPRLKSLLLFDVHLSEELSDIFSCNSPFLEDFEIVGCRGFTQVKILSRSVKRLIINDTDDQIKIITIDAPSIHYFEFTCRSSMPSISFATVASREWKSNISFLALPEISNNNISLWFNKLPEVVKSLRQSQITLDLKRIKDIDGTGLVGYYKPVVVECLDLGEFVSSYEFSAMFNWLFRFFRPKYIRMRMYPNPRGMQGGLEENGLTEFIRKANLKDGEFSRSCFWQQELKESRLELLDNDSEKWCLVQGSRLPIIAPSLNNRGRHRIRFVLDWSESYLPA